MVKFAGPGISASIPQPQALLTSVAVDLEPCLECAGTNGCFGFFFHFFFLSIFPPTSQWDVSVVLTSSSSSWCGNRDVLQECCHLTLRVFKVF